MSNELNDCEDVLYDDYVADWEYDNTVLKDQIFLYLSYLDFFKNTQIKHLSKLLHKMNSLKKEINDEIYDEINDEIDNEILPPTPNTETKSSVSECETKSYVSECETKSSVSECETKSSMHSNYEDYDCDLPYLELTTLGNIAKTSRSETISSDMSDISSSVKSTIATTSTEKKNEKSIEQNVEEKPAKKKGRPRTKDNAKTKLDKKKEDTDSKGCFAPDTSEKGFVDASHENTENFGVTIDQINALSDTVAMVISE
jgi:hypothetical protein